MPARFRQDREQPQPSLIPRTALVTMRPIVVLALAALALLAHAAAAAATGQSTTSEGKQLERRVAVAHSLARLLPFSQSLIRLRLSSDAPAKACYAQPFGVGGQGDKEVTAAVRQTDWSRSARLLHSSAPVVCIAAHCLAESSTPCPRACSK